MNLTGKLGSEDYEIEEYTIPIHKLNSSFVMSLCFSRLQNAFATLTPSSCLLHQKLKLYP